MLLTIAGFLLFALIVYLVREAYFKPGVSSVPGPFLCKFTDLPELLSTRGGQHGKRKAALFDKYGPYVRVGPNAIQINDPKLVDPIYSVKHDFPKSDAIKTWTAYKDGQEVPGMAITQDKKEHGRLRKPVAAAFSLTSLTGLEPYVDQTIKYFFKRLNEEFVSTGKPCDIDNWFQYFAYDVVGELTFGRRLGFLEAGGDSDGSLEDLNSEFSYRAAVGCMPWVDWVLRRNPLVLRLRNFSSRFAQRAGAHIGDRIRAGAPDPSRRDLLSHFLEAQKAHPDIVTPNVLAGYTMAPLVAGSDTSGVYLRSVLYYCLRNPTVLTRLRDEIRAARADKTLPIPYRTATERLPYLEAVMREAARIHAIGPGGFKRVVPPGHAGLQLGGHDGPRLPPGTVVMMSQYTLAKDKDVYGADADVFNPGRWLQAKDETEEQYTVRVREMNRCDLTWGMGSRSCVGKNVAKLGMYKVLPTMFEMFDIQLVHPEREWKVEEKFFSRQSDMDIYIRWRPGRRQECLQD